MPEFRDLVYVEKIERQGQEKPVYHKCGVVMIKDDGKISVKITTIPVGNFNGWLSAFEQKERSAKAEPAGNEGEPEPF